MEVMVTQKRAERSRNWLDDRMAAGAAGIVLAGFVARFWMASGTFLNADEALHFRIANQTSLAAVYRASLAESHPPLLYWVEHFARWAGTSEIWLRLPSAIAGAIFCWLLWLWVCRTLGQLAGFVAVVLASFLLPIVRLSAEIRQYSLILMFLAAAAYFFECAYTEASTWKTAASFLSLYLAILSHYSAILFAAGFGVYGLVRIVSRRSRRVAIPWAIGQFGTLALILFLYKTHLSHLGRGEARSVLEGWMSEFYLRRSYFEAGHDNPFLFVVGHTFGVFQFIFGQLAVGDLAGAAFLVAIGMLSRRSAVGEELSDRRRIALLFVLLFAIGCGASLAHVYPYGGTRHSAFLIIPALGGCSYAISRFAGGRWVPGTAIGLIVVVLCGVLGKQHQPYMTRADQSVQNMDHALMFLHENVTGSEIIFTDYESSMILGHYLCSQQTVSVEKSNAQFETFSCGGHRIVTANRTTATNFTPAVFVGLGPSLVSTYGLRNKDRVWIFQAGWGADLAERLSESPDFEHLRFLNFGRNICVFKLVVDSGTLTKGAT
jgi:hypothetical protein